jgi:hypothetical protein
MGWKRRYFRIKTQSNGSPGINKEEVIIPGSNVHVAEAVEDLVPAVLIAMNQEIVNPGDEKGARGESLCIIQPALPPFGNLVCLQQCDSGEIPDLGIFDLLFLRLVKEESCRDDGNEKDDDNDNRAPGHRNRLFSHGRHTVHFNRGINKLSWEYVILSEKTLIQDLRTFTKIIPGREMSVCPSDPCFINHKPVEGTLHNPFLSIMEKSVPFRQGTKAVIIVSLVILCLLAPLALAAEQEIFGQVDPLTTIPELNSSAISAGNMTLPPQYQNTPSPVTVFKVEVTASSLPGPRDMAYGPSVIGLSIDPVTLVVIILIFIIVIVGYLYFQRNQDRKS